MFPRRVAPSRDGKASKTAPVKNVTKEEKRPTRTSSLYDERNDSCTPQTIFLDEVEIRMLSCLWFIHNRTLQGFVFIRN